MSKRWWRLCWAAIAVPLMASAVGAAAAGPAPNEPPAAPAASAVPAATTTTAPQNDSPWLRVFSGPSYGALFDAMPTADGHVVAVGATEHRHMPPYSGDALLVKVAVADGAVVWERTWGGDGFEQAWAVAPAADGGFYVFGETDSQGAGNRDFFLLKADADGEQIWFRTYGTREREWPFGMLSLAGGDLLMYGEIRSEGGGQGPDAVRGEQAHAVRSEDPYAVRVDPEGNVVWEYTDRAGPDTFFLDAVETAAGQIILCTSVAQDGALTALNHDGSRAWTQRYELDGWQYPSAIEGADGGYLLAGFAMIDDGSSRQADVWLARTSASGELEWQRSFGDPGSDDYGMNLLRLSDSEYLIAGFGRGLPLWKIDGSGEVLRERRLDDSSSYAAGALIELHDGGLLVSGLKVIVNGQSSDAVLLRADAEG